MNNFYGTQLRHRRESLGLTQTQVANMLGLPPTRISEIERGVRRASAARLAVIENALTHANQQTQPEIEPMQAVFHIAADSYLVYAHNETSFVLLGSV